MAPGFPAPGRKDQLRTVGGPVQTLDPTGNLVHLAHRPPQGGDQADRIQGRGPLNVGHRLAVGRPGGPGGPFGVIGQAAGAAP